MVICELSAPSGQRATYFFYFFSQTWSDRVPLIQRRTGQRISAREQSYLHDRERKCQDARASSPLRARMIVCRLNPVRSRTLTGIFRRARERDDLGSGSRDYVRLVGHAEVM